MLEHPQLENWTKTKLDFLGNAEHYKMVQEFFGSRKEEMEGGTVMGRPCVQADYFK